MQSGLLTYPFPVDKLKKWQVSNILDELSDAGRVVQGKDNTTVGQALKMMESWSVSSFLVYQEQQSSKEEGKEEVKEGAARDYLYMVTLKDIIHYVVFRLDDPHSKDFMMDPIKSVQGIDRESMTLPVLSVNDDLFKVASLMRKKLHFAVVISQDEFQKQQENINKGHLVFQSPPRTGKDLFVISQGDVVEFLANRPHELMDYESISADSMSESALQVDPNQPVTDRRVKFVHHQKSDVPALTCFKSMMIHKLSALAIVDEHGKLIETLSATDFLRFGSRPLDDLNKPVIEFLNDSYAVSVKPVLVHPSNNLKQVLDLFREHRVHRIWITDERSGKPIGCVSMSDVLATVLPAYPSEE